MYVCMYKCMLLCVSVLVRQTVMYTGVKKMGTVTLQLTHSPQPQQGIVPFQIPSDKQVRTGALFSLLTPQPIHE